MIFVANQHCSGPGGSDIGYPVNRMYFEGIDLGPLRAPNLSVVGYLSNAAGDADLQGVAISPLPFWGWTETPPMGWNSYDGYDDSVTVPRCWLTLAT